MRRTFFLSATSYAENLVNMAYLFLESKQLGLETEDLFSNLHKRGQKNNFKVYLP